MTMARELAKRSHDPTYQVGALVVTRENTQVLSLGYNGNYPGGPHVRASMSPGESGFIHAEVNALIKLDFNHPTVRVMYVTLSPCEMCAKLILAAKVNEVVYADQYRDLSGVRLLDREGVKVRQYKLDADTPPEMCIVCKKKPKVTGGRFCGVACAIAHVGPEEIDDKSHPVKSAAKKGGLADPKSIYNKNVILVGEKRYALSRDGKIAVRSDGGPYILTDNDVVMGFCVDGAPLVAGRDEPLDDYK